MSCNCENCAHWHICAEDHDLGSCDAKGNQTVYKSYYCDDYAGIEVPRICATCAWWDPDGIPRGGSTSARLCSIEECPIYTYPEHSCSKYARYSEKGEKTMDNDPSALPDDFKIPPLVDIPYPHNKKILDEANLRTMKERINALELPELIAVAEEIPTDILFQVLSLRFKKLEKTVGEIKNIFILNGGKE